jgi:putative ABC transport system ATP-binding protein
MDRKENALITPDADLAIDIAELCFSWSERDDPVLDIERLQVQRGERIFIQGPSGSGKSTLLGLIAGVVTPQKGSIRVTGQTINALSGPDRDRFRADHVGFIYQMFNLIPYLSVVENVTLPCRFSRRRRTRARDRSSNVEADALRLLGELGMGGEEVIRKSAIELSVGQQQRVAAARALIGSPEIIIADEPTSSLDAGHREAFLELLFKECDLVDTTMVYVSHDTALEPNFGRTIRLAEINSPGRERT